MASNDFLENAISSKIDEKSLTDLTNSLESSLPTSATITNQVATSGLQPRLVVRTVAPVVSSQGTILQRLPASQGSQVIRTGGMVMTGGQRLVNPGGQVLVAPPGQQLVRTSSGQILQLPQTGQRPGGTVVRGAAVPNTVAGAGAALQRVVINQPGMRPGQPGSQITVPLSTLQSLQAGQGIPTGTPGHLLVKTESGQYQILRVGQQNTVRAAAPQVRLPTQPVAIARPPAPAQPAPSTNSNTAANTNTASPASGGGMGQQMTPDTAKIKCKNFLATLLRLASDQPDTVATNVRSLIQGLIEGRVEPEVFTTKLQRELNSSPQPCLVPFLRKSLPYLQHSLATRELTIEGVTPPNLSQVGKLPPATSLSGVAPAPALRTIPGTVRPGLARPTLVRPGSSMPQLPTRPLPVQINTNTTHLMPPPGVLTTTAQRDKKTGGAYSAAGDDDINDVAAMGGVNLAEEANKILGATDNVGSIIRSVKDESFLQTGLLSQRAARICKEKGLESPSAEVLNLISHATQERLKNLVSKLSVVAEHRLDIIKTEGPYVVTQDVKQQLRFLEDLDKMERRRHEEEERELLMKAAKSRAKTDDPEKEKLKAKAKEIQKDEADRIRYEEANKTALEAIGNVKKRKFGDIDSKMGPPTSTNISLRTRTKRVHVRDLLFLMEQEKCLRHSNILFKSYCS